MSDKGNTPIMVYEKHADTEKNRIIIPKAIIDAWGRDFYLELYNGHMVLKPIKRGK